MLALPFVALLGQVAKVDIRATGTVNADILKSQLNAAYAGAVPPIIPTSLIPLEDMTVNTAIAGSYVIEVDTTVATAADLDGYWCANDPALRNLFKDLAVIATGLSDVTDVVTCIGASGEGCASSTPCGGGGTEEPAPEPAPDNGGGNDKKDDDDGGGLSAVAIVFIVLGTLFVLGFLIYLLWPWFQTCLVPNTAHAEPIMTPVTPTPSGVALPMLSNVA